MNASNVNVVDSCDQAIAFSAARVHLNVEKKTRKLYVALSFKKRRDIGGDWNPVLLQVIVRPELRSIDQSRIQLALDSNVPCFDVWYPHHIYAKAISHA